MKYSYRNRKTGEVITTSNRVSGKNWEPVENDLQQLPVDDIPDNDIVDEPAPSEKPAAKPARKGKK